MSNIHLKAPQES